jgi:hypothetical protein
MANFWDNDPVAAPAGNAKAAYKMTPDDAQTLNTMAKALPMKRLLAQRAQEAMQVQGTGGNGLPTGPALANLNVAGHDLNPIRALINGAAALAPDAVLPGSGGIPAGKLADGLQRMDQINSATFANMRPEGSGRIMQSEVQPFKQAFPSTASYGTNNSASAGQFSKEYNDALKQYQFVSNFVKNGHGAAADALAAYDAQNADQAAQGAPVPPAAPIQRPAAQAAPAQPTQQQRMNAMLQARSAQTAAPPAPPAANGAVVDIFGRPVQ